MQRAQGVLLFLVLAVNSAQFRVYIVTRSYSSRPFLCALARNVENCGMNLSEKCGAVIVSLLPLTTRSCLVHIFFMRELSQQQRIAYHAAICLPCEATIKCG